jgi:hypothetical protein
MLQVHHILGARMMLAGINLQSVKAAATQLASRDANSCAWCGAYVLKSFSSIWRAVSVKCSTSPGMVNVYIVVSQ